MKKHIALGLVASTLFLAGCCTTHHATVWEYKTVGNIKEVNELASQGWVVAGYSEAVTPGNSTWDSFLMKHPKQ